jgi:hypothetical protein
MAAKRNLAAGVCLALIALGLYLFVFRTPKSDDHPSDPTAQESGEDPRTQSTGTNERQRPGLPGHPVLDQKRAAEMREQIRALMAEAGPAWGEPESATVDAHRTGYPEMPAAVGSADQNQSKEALGQYIRSVMREQFIPLARQCYENMSAKHPGVTLKVELDYRIVGDKRVGGVVDQASLSTGDGGAPLDPEFDRCMTESMMSVSFDAPPKGGQITVKSPLELSPDPSD